MLSVAVGGFCMSVPVESAAGGLTSYLEPSTAEDYRSWDDAACWLLGYPFVPRALGLASRQGSRVLDLGCGTGMFSCWVARRYGVQVIGVDSSPHMLALAAEHYADPSVSYHSSVDDRVPFLRDGSVDAAMACFVFNCIEDPERLQVLVAEVGRVLRSGGRFTILSPHPEHADGLLFEGFRRGAPGARYRAGQPIPVQVRRNDGSWVRIVDTYWPAATYHELLIGAGFRDVHEYAPTVEDAIGVARPDLVTARPWTQERQTPPFLLVTACRFMGASGVSRSPENDDQLDLSRGQ